MNRLIPAVLAILFSPHAAAGPDSQQITTSSWHGLSGLYVMPTARMIGAGNLCIGFNESKHTEFLRGGKYTDRQIRGLVTYGVNDSIEIHAAYCNNVYAIPAGGATQLHNTAFLTFGLKALVLREHPRYWYPALAIGIRDITDHTSDTGPLRNVNNGTKLYVLASKRVLRNEETGRFMDLHAGLAYGKAQPAALLGFELTLAPNASLIAEGIWDSPYLDFRRFGENDVAGPFLFNTGLRIYPELLPGLVLDMGFIGDSEFEFSFGISYVAHL